MASALAVSRPESLVATCDQWVRATPRRAPPSRAPAVSSCSAWREPDAGEPAPPARAPPAGWRPTGCAGSTGAPDRGGAAGGRADRARSRLRRAAGAGRRGRRRRRRGHRGRRRRPALPRRRDDAGRSRCSTCGAGGCCARCRWPRPRIRSAAPPGWRARDGVVHAVVQEPEGLLRLTATRGPEEVPLVRPAGCRPTPCRRGSRCCPTASPWCCGSTPPAGAGSGRRPRRRSPWAPPPTSWSTRRAPWWWPRARPAARTWLRRFAPTADGWSRSHPARRRPGTTAPGWCSPVTAASATSPRRVPARRRRAGRLRDRRHLPDLPARQRAAAQPLGPGAAGGLPARGHRLPRRHGHHRRRVRDRGRAPAAGAGGLRAGLPAVTPALPPARWCRRGAVDGGVHRRPAPVTPWWTDPRLRHLRGAGAGAPGPLPLGDAAAARQPAPHAAACASCGSSSPPTC